MKIQNEEAVSPVIGVILMVAITVILAAVIAAFVFGLAGTTGSSKNVGLIAQKNSTDNGFDVTISGGTDLPTVTAMQWSINNSWFVFDGSPTYGVGNILWTGSEPNSDVRFRVRGNFTDGSQQVLFDKQF